MGLEISPDDSQNPQNLDESDDIQVTTKTCQSVEREYEHMSRERGFTLIEILILLAIVGILTSIAMPAYQNYSNRAAFSQLVMAVTPRKAAVELAVQTRSLFALDDLDGGSFNIPDDVAVAATTHGASVIDGTIIMTWQDDGTNLAGVTYTLTASGITPPVQWTEGGTCQTKRLC